MRPQNNQSYELPMAGRALSKDLQGQAGEEEAPPPVAIHGRPHDGAHEQRHQGIDAEEHAHLNFVQAQLLRAINRNAQRQNPIGKDDSDSARRMARSESAGSTLIGLCIQSLHWVLPRADYSMRDQKPVDFILLAWRTAASMAPGARDTKILTRFSNSRRVNSTR